MLGLYLTRLDASGGYRVPSNCSGGLIPLDIGIPACAAIGWSGVTRLIPPDIDGWRGGFRWTSDEQGMDPSAAAPLADAGGVAMPGIPTSQLFLWFVYPFHVSGYDQSIY